MSKLDVYLRSIEKFGASGAILTSGQAVTLRFPTGDRNATQVVPHDQLVPMVREIAPPAALDAVDRQQPARFQIESGGLRYTIGVTPRPGAWQVTIEGGAAPAATATPARGVPRAASAPIDAGGEMEIERGQYDVAPEPSALVTTSGSAFLDQLTTQARSARATDIFLSAGSPPHVRIAGETQAAERASIEGDVLSRELGVVAPADARAAWIDGGPATFAYSDGAGRVRVTLSRDRRGPGAALRLLHNEAPSLERLNLGAEVGTWLAGAGLVIVAGGTGTGKTTLLAALVRALGDRRRQVATFEDPIEVVQTGPSISQRAVGEHVPSAAAGVAMAMREGVDAIVIGAVTSADTAAAVIDAVAGGQLVLTTIVAPDARIALARLVGQLPAADRELATQLCQGALRGGITASLGRGGARSFEVSAV